MINNRYGVIGAAALALLLAFPAAARQPDLIEGAWIVELESPPTVEFRGGVNSALEAGGPRAAKSLQATAPEITGASRLDVRSPAVRAYAAHLDGERSGVLLNASIQLGRDLEPRHVYRHLFNGFSARMTPAEAARLAKMPGVRSVTPEFRHYLHADAGPEWTGADRFWVGADGIEGANQGEGMILGLVDTGINWDHPYFDEDPPADDFIITNPRPGFLGECDDEEVKCNGKLIGVYDFTDEGTKGRDPNNHGSHVATGAVGNRFDFTLQFGGEDSGIPDITMNTSGMAPRANLISYKACQDADPDDPEDNGGCPGSALIAALEQAVIDEVDVVNYSIGTTGTPPSPWLGFGGQQATPARLFLNLREAGIVAVTSAGNAGPVPGSISSPANAPWAVAVANATHDRRLVNRLVNAIGGDFSLGEIVGAGITPGVGPRTIVYAGDFGHPLCGAGEPELQPNCEDHTGASNPFAPGTFDGEIVVCDRGDFGRVEKGFNVREAGAGGMILANTVMTGDLASVNADQHCLPATHVNKVDGDRLRAWLASGPGHSGRLTGLERAVRAEFGGRLSSSSSRGPAQGAPDVMKPNLTGPGSNILGATADEEATIALLSGTSMSSPYVAGAALLLRKANPDWPPSAIISALETTARADDIVETSGQAAQVTGRGAGRIRVDDAARAGLYLPVSRQEFVDANPAAGGDPGALNLPGILAENCVRSCSFTRRVRALRSGSWSISTEGNLDIEVQPGGFTLGEGGEQELNITIRSGSVQIGDWGRGSVVLNGPSGTAQQRLPVGAFISAGTLPVERNITADANRGRSELEIEELDTLPEAVFRTSPLVKPEREVRNLPQHQNRDEPYSRGPGTFFILVDVPQDTLMLYAETVASAAEDIDLFVGRDDNGNGEPDLVEERCRGITPDEFELCTISNPEPGTWWILVQNWDASAAGAQDRTELEVAVLTAADDSSLVVSGPGLHEGGPLTLPLFWDQPEMRRNERRIGAVGVAADPDSLANVGVVPIRIVREGINPPGDTALDPGTTQTVVVPGNTVHDRLFVDVPAGADGLSVGVAAPSGVTGSLRRLDFDELDGFEPSTPAAPGGTVGSVVGTPGGFVLNVTAGAGPIPGGRYYVFVENTNSGEAELEVTVTLDEPGRITPRRGLWSPKNRTTFQGIEWQRAGDDAFVVWYTYNEDGTPAFFISDAGRVDPESSAWTAPLFRVTSNGVRQTLDVVGRVSVTALAEDELIFSWRVNGQHGSEIFSPDHGIECPTLDGQKVDLLGHWFPDGVREGGATALFVGDIEVWIRYYFDRFGNPRWVQLAGLLEPQALPDGVALEVLDFRGFCPYCEPVDLGPEPFETVGVFERLIFSTTSAREVLDFVVDPPMDTDYSTDRDLTRLSEVRACP